MFIGLAAIFVVVAGLSLMLGAHAIAQRAFALAIIVVFLSPLLNRVFSVGGRP